MAIAGFVHILMFLDWLFELFQFQIASCFFMLLHGLPNIFHIEVHEVFSYLFSLLLYRSLTFFEIKIHIIFTTPCFLIFLYRLLASFWLNVCSRLFVFTDWLLIAIVLMFLIISHILLLGFFIFMI